MPNLIGQGESLSLSLEEWAQALQLAHLYGWKPAGTLQPEPEDASSVEPALLDQWDGRYFDPLAQWVTDEDARRLGAALQAALPELADGPGDPGSPQEVFPDLGKKSVERLIALCLSGALQIR